MQLVGHAAEPLHRYGEQDGFAPADPTETRVQVPGIAVQTSQPPEQAVLQQRPSEHSPLAQVAAPPEHDCPFLSLHAPVASQVLVPVHCGLSSAFLMAVQVPSAPDWLQLKHAVMQLVSQQFPSTQLPVRHWAAAVHAVPLAC